MSDTEGKSDPDTRLVQAYLPSLPGDLKEDEIQRQALRAADSYQDILRSIDLHSVADPYNDILRSIDFHKQIISIADPYKDILNGANAPLQEIARAAEIARGSSMAAAEFVSSMAAYDAKFRLPHLEELSRWRQDQDALHVAANRFLAPHSEMLRAAELLHEPWLYGENAARSLSAFAGIQGMGHALHTLPPFDDDLAGGLRYGLGDWREPLDLCQKDLADPLQRTELYIARGLDTNLTDFPPRAFEQITAVAGLDADICLESAEGIEESNERGGEEGAFVRTNRAHRTLLHFEIHVRRFIEARMTSAFGPKWIKQRVPERMRLSWEEKREKALDAGEQELSLIYYADFTDYVQIITRNDNWREVFQPVFRRVALVQESFQRLFPIRICTMHARLITHDDHLYLVVETRRLLKAMGAT